MMCNLKKRLIRAGFWVLLQAMNDRKQTAQRLKLQERPLTINKRNIIRWKIYRHTKTSIQVFLKISSLKAQRNSLVFHGAPSTAHNIATSKVAAVLPEIWKRVLTVLPTSAKRTDKGCFYRAKAFIRNNNAADRLTASWFAIERQENERNVRDPEVCGGFHFAAVELWKY